MPAIKDVYVNQAYLSVTESAANTLTFSKLETGVSIYEKVAWLISRIDYDFDLEATNFGATDDQLAFGLCVSDQITNIGLVNSAVIERNRVKRVDLGAAASGLFSFMPYQKDFSELPGGGLLVPPNPVYIFAEGTNLTTPMWVNCRMFYTVKGLSGEDFWELVEQRRMIGA